MFHTSKSKLAHATMFAPGTAFARWGAKACANSKNPMQGPPAMRVIEEVSKAVLYRCKDCGDCSLPDIAYLCPESQCAKNQRNGPCGGVRPDGNCEVKPEMRCVWVKAVERAPKTPWAHEIHDIRQPVDNRLWNTSSWVNYFTKRDKQAPKGWNVEA